MCGVTASSATRLVAHFVQTTSYWDTLQCLRNGKQVLECVIAKLPTSTCPPAHPPACLFIYLSVYPSAFVRPFTRLSARPTNCPPTYLSVRLSICPSVRMSVRPTMHPPIHPSNRHPSVHSSIYPSASPPACRTNHINAYRSVCAFIRLSVRLSNTHPPIYTTIQQVVGPSMHMVRQFFAPCTDPCTYLRKPTSMRF